MRSLVKPASMSLLMLVPISLARAFDVYRLVLPTQARQAQMVDIENWRSSGDNTVWTLDPRILFTEPELRRAADSGVLEFRRIELSLGDLSGLSIDRRLQPLLSDRNDIPDTSAIIDALTTALRIKKDANAGIPAGYTEQSWRAEILDRLEAPITVLAAAVRADAASVPKDIRAKALEIVGKYAYLVALYNSVEHQHAYRKAGEIFAPSPQEEFTAYMIAGWYLDQALRCYTSNGKAGQSESIEDIKYHLCSCYYGLRQLSPTGHYLRMAEEAYGDFIANYPSSSRARRAAMILAAFWSERAWDGLIPKEEALRHVQQMLETANEEWPPMVFSRLHLLAGELYAIMDRNQKALEHLRQAIHYAGKDPDPVTRRRTEVFAHYYALTVCLRMGDENAVQPHAMYLRDNPPQTQDVLFNANLEEFREYIHEVAGAPPLGQ